MTPPPSDSQSPSGGSSRPDGTPTRRAARRPSLSTRARLGGEVGVKRSPQALAVSVLLHIVVAVVVVQLLTFGHGLSGFLDFGNDKEKLQERLTYVETQPKPVAKPTVAAAQPVRSRPLQAPSANVAVGTPDEAPPSAPPPARADTGSGGGRPGTGNGVGELNPDLKGVKPSLGDARVWAGPSGNGRVATQRNGAERLDSVIGYAITAARDSLDSLARAQGKYDRALGDWTKTTKDGSKWGWDQGGIRLGKVTIPNALLALLPLNASTAAGMSGNYTSMEREKRLSQSRADILRMSERSLGEVEFRKIANELRDRRERERRDRLKAPSASVAPTAPMPPKSSDKIDR